MIKTGILGTTAEKLAEKHLKNKGLKTIERNYHCRYGEIDLIMMDCDTLVFIEVRYRKSTHFGGALESIDHRKQKKLQLTAQTYLNQSKKHDLPCRFDILCLQGELKSAHYQWIQNAFDS